jgi:exopolysaccharide biosynthesis polyprenyl glycosylphosphotransferase
MPKSQRTAYIALAWILDALALVCAFMVAVWWREGLGNTLVTLSDWLGLSLREWVRQTRDLPPLYRIVFSPNPLVNAQNHLYILYLAIPTWLFCLHAQRAYDPQAQRNGRQEFALCAYGGLMGTMAMVVFFFLAKFDVSRLLLGGFMLFGVTLLWFERRQLLPLLLRGGREPMRRVLLIGDAAQATSFLQVLETPAYRGSKLIGFISDDSKLPEVEGHDVPYLGVVGDLAKVLDRDVIDEVIIVRSQAESVPISFADKARPGHRSPGQVWGDILELCLERGRTVSLVDDIVPPANAKVEATMMGTLPTLVLHNTPQNTLALVLKGVMDRGIAAVMLFILTFIFPVFPVIALIIKLQDRGPVFFTQERVGLNGRIFKFYKFRSMATNAQAILEKMKREEPERYRAINIMEEPFFKAREGEDPRITPIGRIIRKYSLDELPQFYNVLRGDMSLVGPRPPLPKEVEELEPWQRRKLSVKGGLTCIWQASGRNEITDVDEWMRLDLEYIDNWSLWLDVKLLFKTLKVLVNPKGAS